MICSALVIYGLSTARISYILLPRVSWFSYHGFQLTFAHLLYVGLKEPFFLTSLICEDSVKPRWIYQGALVSLHMKKIFGRNAFPFLSYLGFTLFWRFLFGLLLTKCICTTNKICFILDFLRQLAEQKAAYCSFSLRSSRIRWACNFAFFQEIVAGKHALIANPDI